MGHSLVGLAIALGCLPARGATTASAFIKRHRTWLCLAVVLANLPDIDYLPGLLVGDWNAYHHATTHTLGWIVLVGAGCCLTARVVQPRPSRRVYMLIGLCLFSHLLLDWVGDDGSYPYGIMAVWPFSSDYTMSPVTVFWQLKKAGWADLFQIHNLVAVLVEVAWTLPLAVMVWMWKGRGGRTMNPPSPRLRRASDER